MIYLTPFLTAYVAILVFLIGISMGSFLNCSAIRILNGEPIARGRSHCMSCGHTLGFLDLIPLFSWIFLKGKCRYCHEKISARYPLTELAMGSIYVLLVLKCGLSLRFLELVILTSILLALSLCDYDAYIIPDRFIIAGLVVRIIFCVIYDVQGYPTSIWLESLIGALSVSLPVLVIVLIMERILKKEAMGGGDIKLFFMVGSYFTWDINVFSLIVSCIVGIAFGLISQKKDEEKHIPFGPAISIAWVIGMLIGPQVTGWYMGLF